MYVYGNIQTDARVKRTAKALSKDYELSLMSTDIGVKVDDDCYHNILLKCDSFGLCKYFQSVIGAIKVIKKEKPDLFYAHDYYSALIVKLLLKRRHCKKIVYDAHELIIPEKKNKSARLAFFYHFERAIVHNVDMMVCASKERAAIMFEHYNLNEPPLVIENISYLSKDCDASPETEALLEKFFSDPRLTLVYAGVVTKGRNIDLLIEKAARFSSKIKLLIVGKGDALDEMKTKAINQNGLNCCFTGSVPYDTLGSILNRCDIGYLFYPTNSLNNIYCASNKIFEYASVGLPIVANENPTIKNIIEREFIGIACDDFDEALNRVLSSINEYKKACYEFVKKNSWETTAQVLRDRIRNIIATT